MECIICNSSIFKPYVKVLKQCVNCGHIVADVDTGSISFKNIYNLSYFKGGAYLDYVKDGTSFERNFRNRLKALRKYCPQGKLLEIGSAYGFFLNLARQYFSVAGYEICREAADYARENFSLDVKTTDFLENNLADASFDVVVMWDVIEHLPNPQDFIEKIYRILKKGGIFVLTTGDIGSLLALYQRKKWRLIHPPLHIHYFSKKTITNLLNKFNLRAINISYPGYWRSIRQISHNLFVLSGNHKESVFKLINSTPLANICIYLNLFDIMQVTSKK